MPKHICINKKIPPYNKTIQISSDKSLSIRTILLASQAVGTSKISNLWIKKDDRIIKNAMRPPIDLNDVPFGDFDSFEKSGRKRSLVWS